MRKFLGHILSFLSIITGDFSKMMLFMAFKKAFNFKLLNHDKHTVCQPTNLNQGRFCVRGLKEKIVNYFYLLFPFYCRYTQSSNTSRQDNSGRGRYGGRRRFREEERMREEGRSNLRDYFHQHPNRWLKRSLNA